MACESTLSDSALLRRMIAGDEEAFTTLYRRHQGRVYRLALHMSGRSSIAEEVTQEVFLVLMQQGRRYDPARGSFCAYLCGIARNHVLRCLDRDGAYVAMAYEVQRCDSRMPEELIAQDNPLQDLTSQERIASVRHAILALPLGYREAVVLCELQEMSYREAAAVVGCSVGTIRSRLHRARALLAKKLHAAEAVARGLRKSQPVRCLT